MIVITGSLAYDHIMDFPGYFKDHILPDKIHILNVSFLVNTLKRQSGGIAGNVAYNLALLGEKPTIIASAGSDFSSYKEELTKLGVDTSNIEVHNDDTTASAFITTDLDDNQIAGFYPGAMSRARDLSLTCLPEKPKLVLIGANDPLAMRNFVEECQRLSLDYIFDPAQQLISLSLEQIRVGVTSSKVVIGNDYEIQLIQKKLNLTKKELLKLTEILITTRGVAGSLIETGEEIYNIPIAKPIDRTDPTGAGDAYRAGIIKGLIRGWDFEKMGRVAALCATYAIEQYGTQEHSFTKGEFEKRFRVEFGEKIRI